MAGPGRNGNGWVTLPAKTTFFRASAGRGGTQGPGFIGLAQATSAREPEEAPTFERSRRSVGLLTARAATPQLAAAAVLLVAETAWLVLEAYRRWSELETRLKAGGGWYEPKIRTLGRRQPR